MWSSESEEYDSDAVKDALEEEQELVRDIKGLALAEHFFGPLLSPVTATEAQWTAYAQLRRATNAKYKNVFVRPKRLISDAVAVIERDMGFNKGTLQKHVSVIVRIIEDDPYSPREARISVRIYSLTVPKYIDVRLDYDCYIGGSWGYSLGYKITHRMTKHLSVFRRPATNGLPSSWHTLEGWQPICWGYFDDRDGNYGRKWRPIERGETALREEGVLDIYEVLFGPIEDPPSDDNDALLEYRKKLVNTVRLLLAVVGIQYKVACTDEEEDVRSYGYTLEALSDKWVARGIRKACGFQLSYDAEEEKRGKREREEAAKEPEENEDEDYY